MARGTGSSKKKSKKRNNNNQKVNKSNNNGNIHNSSKLDSSLLAMMSTPSQLFMSSHLDSQGQSLSPAVVNLNEQFDKILNSEDLVDVFSTPQLPEEGHEKEVTFEMILSIYKVNRCIMGKIATLEQLHQHKFDELVSGIKTLKEEVQEITKSQSLINAKFENQAKEIKNIQNKIKSITNEIKQKDQELDQMKERVRKSEEKHKENQIKVNELEQYGRREMFNIFGVPRKPDENTDDIFFDIADKLGFDLYEDDIEVTHRTSSKPTAPIIVKFNNRRIRDKMYEARWDLKHFTTRDLGFGEEQSIFFNESLTDTNREIFKQAWKALKKTKLYDRVITQNGVTYAWKTYNKDTKSEKKMILSQSDVIKLIPTQS